jgi:hypothetical protein
MSISSFLESLIARRGAYLSTAHIRAAATLLQCAVIVWTRNGEDYVKAHHYWPLVIGDTAMETRLKEPLRARHLLYSDNNHYRRIYVNPELIKTFSRDDGADYEHVSLLSDCGKSSRKYCAAVSIFLMDVPYMAVCPYVVLSRLPRR